MFIIVNCCFHVKIIVEDYIAELSDLAYILAELSPFIEIFQDFGEKKKAK